MRTLSDKHNLMHCRCLLNVGFVVNEISPEEKKNLYAYLLKMTHNGMELLILPVSKSLGLASSRAKRGRRGRWMGFFDSHVLDHPTRCWSAWVCQNWPPVSSKCLQKLENQGVYKLLGAQGSPRCQPPSTWSCGTHIWGREGERRNQRQIQRGKRGPENQ